MSIRPEYIFALPLLVAAQLWRDAIRIYIDGYNITKPFTLDAEIKVPILPVFPIYKIRDLALFPLSISSSNNQC